MQLLFGLRAGEETLLHEDLGDFEGDVVRGLGGEVGAA